MANNANEALLEKLAKLEHEQWQSWARVRNPEHPLANVPYTLLTEEQKEKDREWARKVLAILSNHCITPQQLQHTATGKTNTTDRGLCEFWDELNHTCMEDETAVCADPRVPFCLTRLEAKHRKYKLHPETEPYVRTNHFTGLPGGNPP